MGLGDDEGVDIGVSPPRAGGGAPLFRRRSAAPRGARLFCPRSGFLFRAAPPQKCEFYSSLGSSRARASRTPAAPPTKKKNSNKQGRGCIARLARLRLVPTQDGMACTSQSASLRTRPSRRVSASTEQGAMGAPCPERRLGRRRPRGSSVKLRGSGGQVCLLRQRQSARQ